MKFFTKKSTIQKILFAIIIILLVNFTLSPYGVYAAKDEDDDGWSIGGTLVKEIFGLFNWICDIIMGGLNNFMLGANGFGSAMLSKEDENLDKDSGSWLFAEYKSESENDDENRIFRFKSGEIDTTLTRYGDANYAIPNMLYSPESIFSNDIAALDVNFLSENTYKSIYVSGDEEFKDDANEKAKSSVSKLKTTIASWYKSFRNIAIVGLLSVLIYLGIRILISSTAADKAKYKENLKDWAVALCLVFVIHFIMSAILMLTDKCTELFSAPFDDGYTVMIDGDGKAFKTNLIGLIRFQAQSHVGTTSAVYSIMYWALVIYTCIFTVMYLKRFLYMAFFTMIAPLVALTYPIDRAGDGKAQAFNIWFKEYTMNAIIQPVHLILYAVFVGSAYDLAANNPLYALVSMAFLIPAEKFIKKMFKLDQAESTSGFGSFAGGALAMSALKQLSNVGPGGKGGKSGGKNSGNSDKNSDKGVYMPPNNAGGLNSFESEEEEEKSPKENNNYEPLTGDEDIESVDDQIAREKSGMDAQAYRELGKKPDEWDRERREQLEKERQEAKALNYEDTSSRDSNSYPTKKDTKSNTSQKAGGKIKPIKGYAGRVLKRGARAVGRQLWKNKGKIARGVARGATRAAGVTLGAAVGVAAGITTGDFSKTMQYMGTGALAGSAVGNNLYNGVATLAGGAYEIGKDINKAKNEEKYGLEYAREKERQSQNKKARKEFLRNEEEIKKYRALADKMNYKGDVKTLMNAASDYKDAGITNDKLIQNALQAEYKRDGDINGKNHNQFVDVASFAHENGFDASTINDDKSRKKFENTLDNTSLSDNAKRQVALMTADIFDSRKTYEKEGKYGKTQMAKNNLLEKRK